MPARLFTPGVIFFWSNTLYPGSKYVNSQALFIIDHLEPPYGYAKGLVVSVFCTGVL